MTAMDEKPIILVVDDEPGVRNVLEVLLNHEGYHTYLAADGEQGLELAAELLPDVILLDVMMPKLDGYQVCKRLRADPLLREVAIIMITALSAREAKLDGLNAGADDFISKPIDSIELRARLRTITRLNRYRRLLNEQRRFSWIVEHSTDGYVVLNPHGKLLFANPQAQLYLGIEGSLSSLGRDFRELAERQYRCEPETAWQGWPGKAAPDLSRQSLPQQPLPLYLVRPETLTAQSFWLQVERLDLESAVEKQIVCRLRDITAEKALQTSSATFNAFVSHKLRTPLTSVISSLDVVRLSIAAQDYQGVAEMVEYALQGARRLGNEITDVLNYLYATAESSSESGCVLARLRELAERLSAELGLKMVAIELPAPLEKRLIPLSMSALEIVLREILENSLKFHPRHTPQIKMTAQPQEERVCLRFMDDGIHLAPQQLAHAWTPYHQGEKYFTGEMAGMGLGLSLVANLVWSAGGKTRIHNRADQPGVVVELELPLLPESRTPELVI